MINCVLFDCRNQGEKPGTGVTAGGDPLVYMTGGRDALGVSSTRWWEPGAPGVWTGGRARNEADDGPPRYLLLSK